MKTRSVGLGVILSSSKAAKATLAPSVALPLPDEIRSATAPSHIDPSGRHRGYRGEGIIAWGPISSRTFDDSTRACA